MSDLARSLRRSIAGEEENPLVTIGLAPHVLKLGLSNDELYEYITHDIARRLVMRFHPDRTFAPVEELQRRYGAAYEQLQDRAAFERALSEFRTANADERGELRLRAAALTEVGRQRDLTRDRLQAATTTIARLKLELELATRRTRREEILVPHLRYELKQFTQSWRRWKRIALGRSQQQRDLMRFFQNHLARPAHTRTVTWIAISRPRRFADGTLTLTPVADLEALAVPPADIVRMKRLHHTLKESSVPVLIWEVLRVKEGRTDSPTPRTVLGSLDPTPLWMRRLPAMIEMLSNLQPIVEPERLLVTIYLMESGKRRFYRETRQMILGAG